MPDRIIPYFPKHSDGSRSQDTSTLPEPPSEIGPIYDNDSLKIPLPVFDQASVNASYGKNHADFEPNLPPSPPEEKDYYLVPLLTKHERLRLTLFWYYTRDVVNDKDFLASLQEKLKLVQQYMGWEMAIMGLLGSDVFTRLVTSGIALAVLPR